MKLDLGLQNLFIMRCRTWDKSLFVLLEVHFLLTISTSETYLYSFSICQIAYRLSLKVYGLRLVKGYVIAEEIKKKEQQFSVKTCFKLTFIFSPIYLKYNNCFIPCRNVDIDNESEKCFRVCLYGKIHPTFQPVGWAVRQNFQEFTCRIPSCLIFPLLFNFLTH